MPVYIDTSALAKWYLNEAGSESFSVWIRKQDDVHISSLTALEFRCLLARRQRRGDISPELEDRIFAVFQSDVNEGHLSTHAVNDTHITGAINLLAVVAPTPLRTLDATHLNIALSIDASSIATADKVMACAAAQLGIKVVDFQS